MQLAALMLPGPDFALVMKNTLLYQRQRALFTVLGITISMTTVAAICVYILPLLTANQTLLIRLVRYLGAAYLSWLSLQAFRHWRKVAHTNTPEKLAIAPISHTKAFIQGSLCNITNPKCLLFYISLFSLILNQSNRSGTEWIYLVIIFMQGGLWFSFVVLLLSGKRIKRYLDRIEHLQLWVNRFCAIIFLLFAILLLSIPI